MRHPYSFTRRPDPTPFPGAFIITLNSEYPSIIVTLLNKLRSQVRVFGDAFFLFAKIDAYMLSVAQKF